MPRSAVAVPAAPPSGSPSSPPAAQHEEAKEREKKKKTAPLTSYLAVTPLEGHPHPTSFRLGDELVAYDWTSVSWQLAVVKKVHCSKYSAVAARKIKNKRRVKDKQGIYMDDWDYPLQVTVHFVGYHDVDDSQVLMIDVPFRLLPLSAAPLLNITVPPPALPGQLRRLPRSYCSNCYKGGWLYMCDSCPRCYHDDCLGFMGKDEVALVRVSNPWVCTFCRCNAEGRRNMDAEAADNLRERVLEYRNLEEAFKEKRIDYALVHPDVDISAFFRNDMMRHISTKERKEKVVVIGREPKRRKRAKGKVKTSARSSNAQHSSQSTSPSQPPQENDEKAPVEEQSEEKEDGRLEAYDEEEKAAFGSTDDEFPSPGYDVGGSPLSTGLGEFSDEFDDEDRGSPLSIPSSELVSDGAPNTPGDDGEDVDPFQPGMEDDEVTFLREERRVLRPPLSQGLLSRLSSDLVLLAYGVKQEPGMSSVAAGCQKSSVTLSSVLRSPPAAPSSSLESPRQASAALSLAESMQLVLSVAQAAQRPIPRSAHPPPAVQPQQQRAPAVESQSSLTGPARAPSSSPSPSSRPSSASSASSAESSTSASSDFPSRAQWLGIERSRAERKDVAYDEDEGDDDVQWIPHPSRDLPRAPLPFLSLPAALPPVHPPVISLVIVPSTSSPPRPTSTASAVSAPRGTAAEKTPAQPPLPVLPLPAGPSAPPLPTAAAPVPVRRPRVQLGPPKNAPVVKPDPAVLSTAAAPPTRESPATSASATQSQHAPMEVEADWWSIPLSSVAAQRLHPPSSPSIDSLPSPPPAVPAVPQQPNASNEAVPPLSSSSSSSPPPTTASVSAAIDPTAMLSPASSSRQTEVQRLQSRFNVFTDPSFLPSLPSKRQSKKTQRFIESEEMEATLPPLDPVEGHTSRPPKGKRNAKRKSPTDDDPDVSPLHEPKKAKKGKKSAPPSPLSLPPSTTGPGGRKPPPHKPAGKRPRGGPVVPEDDSEEERKEEEKEEMSIPRGPCKRLTPLSEATWAHLHTAQLDVSALLDECFATRAEADGERMYRATDSYAAVPTSTVSPQPLSRTSAPVLLDRDAAFHFCQRVQSGLSVVAKHAAAAYKECKDEVVARDLDGVQNMQKRLIHHYDQAHEEASLANCWQELIQRFLSTDSLASQYSVPIFTYSFKLSDALRGHLPPPLQETLRFSLETFAAQLGGVDLSTYTTIDLGQVEALFRLFHLRDPQLLSALEAACEAHIASCENDLDWLDTADSPSSDSAFSDGEKCSWEPLHARLVRMDRVKDDVEQLKEALDVDGDFLAQWESSFGRPGRIPLQAMPSIALLVQLREETTRMSDGNAAAASTHMRS